MAHMGKVLFLLRRRTHGFCFLRGLPLAPLFNTRAYYLPSAVLYIEFPWPIAELCQASHLFVR